MSSMNRLCTVLLFAVLIGGLIDLSASKVQKGQLTSSNNWAYVAKFCFNNDGPSVTGYLNWTAYDVQTDTLLLFYDDEDGSWSSVYSQRNDLSCEQKVNMSLGRRLVLDGVSSYELFNDTMRPHYWWIAVAQCGEDSISFQYDFTFMNPGGAWEQQFSYDDQGLVGMYLFFWLVFTLGLMGHLLGVWQMVRNGTYHVLVRLLSAAIVLETTSLFVSFIHYAIYASNGIGSPGLLGLGDLLDMASQLVFMFLLVLIAKGWTITKQEITHKRILLILVSTLLLGYLIMFTWENVGVDPASTLYIYESPPGIVVVILRVLVLLWFLWCLKSTHGEESHPSKKRFYLVFGAIYTAWFLMLPFITLVALGIPAWNRYRVVQGMYLTATMLGYAALGYLFWPSKISEYFQIEKGDFLDSTTLLGQGGKASANDASNPYETL